jgi:D-aminoacyl-tRNA deacylase
LTLPSGVNFKNTLTQKIIMIILVTSKINTASKNMNKLLIEEYGFEETEESFDDNKIYEKIINQNKNPIQFKLITCNKEILEIEYIKNHFQPEHFIILSTHKSEAETKSLSCHISGSFEKGIVPAEPNILRQIFLKLKEKKKEDEQKENKLKEYEVTLEVTHHQPFDLNSPSVWVEVGGTEKEWEDLDACRVCVESVLEIDYYKTENNKSNWKPNAVGFGGPHYAPNFAKDYILDTVAIGHICAKHAINEAKDELILDSFKKSNSNLAIIDWKGTTSEQKNKLTTLFEKHKIEWKKNHELKPRAISQS